MKYLLEKSLDEGAAGLSTGLIYAPGCFAGTRELIELAKLTGRLGGFYASHIRNEAEGVITALEELIRIGREGQVPVHVSHLKVAGYNNWHLREVVVEKLENARSEGIDITCDVYPYFHSCTTLLALLPPWSLEGGVPSLIRRLAENSGTTFFITLSSSSDGDVHTANCVDVVVIDLREDDLFTNTHAVVTTTVE